MALGRQGDQLLNTDLQQILVPSAAYAAAAYHVGLTPTPGMTGSNPFPTTLAGLGLKAGALAAGATDLLYSGGKYLALVINITNANGGTLTVTIRGMDPISGPYLILASAGLVANAQTILRVGPALTAAANAVANDFLPISWNLDVLVATATMTFSITALQMP
jgi:hypothetical protein